MGRTVFRPLDGLLLLDKPAGLSSNQALQRARLLFRAEKGGHTGALDPLATGLLPLCFGEATKIAGLLLGGRKAYEAGVTLGRTTDTDDADGEVLRERPVPALDRARVEAALVPLTGRIRQRPPIFSALKQGGEPLYAKARRGELKNFTGIDSPYDLTGLYEGRPLTERSIDQSGGMPDRVTLYRIPILVEWIETGEKLEGLVRHVLIHEIGHHFGFSDDDMHALEDMA